MEDESERVHYQKGKGRRKKKRKEKKEKVFAENWGCGVLICVVLGLWGWGPHHITTYKFILCVCTHTYHSLIYTYVSI